MTMLHYNNLITNNTISQDIYCILFHLTNIIHSAIMTFLKMEILFGGLYIYVWYPG